MSSWFKSSGSGVPILEIDEVTAGVNDAVVVTVAVAPAAVITTEDVDVTDIRASSDREIFGLAGALPGSALLPRDFFGTGGVKPGGCGKKLLTDAAAVAAVDIASSAGCVAPNTCIATRCCSKLAYSKEG